METTLQETVKIAWHKSKWIVKGFIIGFIALLMLIPMLYVKSLIFEREKRQQEAAHEITGKWAGPQNMIGPVIAVPFWKTEEDTAQRAYTTKHIAYFLPDELTIDATLNPREKHRGIYKVMLYDTKINIKGSFALAENFSAEEKTILLVDDVMTSGATLEACARILKEAGAKNIAQDEKTCVVYGMPKAAVDAGAVHLIKPLDQIAENIAVFLQKVNP